MQSCCNSTEFEMENPIFHKYNEITWDFVEIVVKANIHSCFFTANLFQEFA